MSTFRDTVTWVIALLGAVAVYDAFGHVWLAAWTVGVMAFVHSRNWSGTFPGDDVLDAPDGAPAVFSVSEHHERGGAERRDVTAVVSPMAGSARAVPPHRFDADGVCVHTGCGTSRRDTTGVPCRGVAGYKAA